MAEHTKYRKPRSQNHLPSSSTTTVTATAAKKNNFTAATFRGLGCTASSQVSVPEVIRTSANWNANKVKKKKVKIKKIDNNNNKFRTNNSTAVIITSNLKNNNSPSSNSSQPLTVSSNCGGLPDVWCGPGIGVTGDAASASNCAVSRRPAVSARSKAEGVDRIIHNQRKHSSNNMRRMVTSEDNPFHDPGIALEMQCSRADVSGSRYHRNLRHDFHDGFAEIVMLQSSLLMGGRSERSDQYRGWRLDVDNMSYEELLELGDRIGHVNTGLSEDEISACLRRTKVMMLANLLSNFPTEKERKCSICQDEYNSDDETGKLNCGHFYHIRCIKQWLVQKNVCPICKKPAMPQNKTI